ncbi:MAG: acyltransferase [Eubacterium sp.]|nr:acyltransferase [Eubacterium sp.]
MRFYLNEDFKSNVFVLEGWSSNKGMETMSVKRRIASLDLIRVVAIYMIFNYHFCRKMGAAEGFFFRGYANGGWGAVGTAAFFMLSGYALSLNHREVRNIREFYRRRFLSFYIPVWLTYACAFFASAALKRLPSGLSAWKLIFSVLGIDGYLTLYQVETWYLTGEWFNFTILVLYLLYPLLRRLFRDHFRATTAALAVLYLAGTFFEPLKIQPDTYLSTGIFLFWIGMLIEDRIKFLAEHRIPVMLIAAGAGLLIMFVPLSFNELILKNLLGIAVFLFLRLVVPDHQEGKKHIQEELVSNGEDGQKTGGLFRLLTWLSAISFEVYLTHHIIINTIADWLLVNGSSTGIQVRIYILALLMTLAGSAVLYAISKKLLKKLLPH